MNHDPFPYPSVILVLIWFIGFFSGYSLGYGQGEEKARKIAIEKNVGFWVIDPVTGTKSFEYGARDD